MPLSSVVCSSLVKGKGKQDMAAGHLSRKKANSITGSTIAPVGAHGIIEETYLFTAEAQRTLRLRSLSHELRVQGQ